MDKNTALEDLKKRLEKAKVELEVINLFGDYDSPKKRREWELEIAELEKLIQKSERELEKRDKGNVARANPHTD